MIFRLEYYHYLLLILIFSPFLRVQAATKSATISITANITAACNAGSVAGGNISFGTLNFGSHSLLNQEIKLIGQANSGAILVQCSPSVSYKITMGGGNSNNTAQRSMKGTNYAQQVNYNLYSDANYSAIWDNITGVTRIATGNQEWISVYGRVPAQTTPRADVYQDTVVVTVAW